MTQPPQGLQVCTHQDAGIPHAQSRCPLPIFLLPPLLLAQAVPPGTHHIQARQRWSSCSLERKVASTSRLIIAGEDRSLTSCFPIWHSTFWRAGKALAAYPASHLPSCPHHGPCCGGDCAEAHLQQQRFPRVSPALCLVVSAGALLCSRGACIGGSGVIHFGEHASAASSSTSPPSNQGVPVICKCPDFGAIFASCILMLDFYQNETLELTHVYANICMHGLQPLLPAPSINTLSVSYSTASSAFFSQCFSQPGLFSQGGS